MNGEEQNILIVAPSLESTKNVSGVSAVANYMIANNPECRYTHFLQGKSDDEQGGVARLVRLLKCYRRWKALLNSMPAEQIIHYNFPLDAMAVVRDFFFMNAARKQGRRMVIHLHGGLYLFKNDKPLFIRHLLNKIFRWDNPFIVLSDKEKKRIQAEYQAKTVYVLPNSVDLAEASSFVRNDFRSCLHLLFLGRIEPNKGMDYLYDAVKQLQERNIDFVLHFAGIEQGDNGYVERFNQLLGERFIYEGIVTGKKKTELLKTCEVFLLPSFYEGLPISLLECMGFGMIPVTTNVGSISEFVEEGVTGLFVQMKDSQSIADAINRLAQAPDLRRNLSEGARRKIFSTLNTEKYIAKLNEIYQNC